MRRDARAGLAAAAGAGLLVAIGVFTWPGSTAPDGKARPRVILSPSPVPRLTPTPVPGPTSVVIVPGGETTIVRPGQIRTITASARPSKSHHRPTRTSSPTPRPTRTSRPTSRPTPTCDLAHPLRCLL